MRRLSKGVFTRSVLGVVAACLLLPVAIASADEAVHLQYKFVKGDVLRYRTVMETRHVSDGDPSKLQWDCMTTVARVEVRDIDPDGLASIRMVQELLRFEKCDATGGHIYDSQNPRKPESDAEKFMAVYASAIGVPYDMKLAQDGTATIADADAMFRTISTRVAQDPETVTMMQSVRSWVKSGEWKPSGGEMFPVLPTAAVKLGDHWGTEPVSNRTPVGTVTSERSSVLEGLETRTDGQRAHVAITERSTVDQSTSQVPMPAEMKLTIGPSQAETRLVFDMARGRVVRAETEKVTTSEITTPLDDPHRGPTKDRVVVTTRVSLIEVGKMADR